MAISKISGSGIGAINAPVEFTSADNLTQLTLTSTDTDANSGPLLELSRNVTGANNDFLGQVIFKGKDTAGNVHTFGRISNQIKTATSGSETSRMVLTTNVGGSEVSRIDILPTETVINDDAGDLDFRVKGNSRANGIFFNGATGSVGINTPDGDVTGDGTATRTYVGIIGTGNRGRLNLGTTAVNGADCASISFVNGTNELGAIFCDTTSGVQNTGTVFMSSTKGLKFQAWTGDALVINEGVLT